MTIRKRLAALECRKSPPPTDPSGTAAYIRELDALIARREAHIRAAEQNPESYREDFDVLRYGGEPIKDHEFRVNALQRQWDEQHEAWLRTHRPDLAGRGVPEIDAHIAELDKEIKLLEAELAEGVAQGEGRR